MYFLDTKFPKIFHTLLLKDNGRILCPFPRLFQVLVTYFHYTQLMDFLTLLKLIRPSLLSLDSGEAFMLVALLFPQKYIVSPGHCQVQLIRLPKSIVTVVCKSVVYVFGMWTAKKVFLSFYRSALINCDYWRTKGKAFHLWLYPFSRIYILPTTTSLHLRKSILEYVEWPASISFQPWYY